MASRMGANGDRPLLDDMSEEQMLRQLVAAQVDED